MSEKKEISSKTRKDIMKATFRAIREHGYAELTMDKIAEEYDKCKSNLHYHYGTKENLMVDFITYLLEGFKEKVVPDTDDPVKRLDGLIDSMLFGIGEGEIPERFHAVLVELRSQAPHNEKYRKKITENDRFIHNKVKEIIEEGIEKERFKEVNPDQIATIILSTIDGGRARQISTERDVAEKAKEALDQMIESLLLKEQ
ncbi:MAG: TetR/AcrR family transcriptional regulator [Candidatus Thermoplasmatota archaeon]